MAIFQKSVVEKFLSELEESVIDSAYSRFKEVYSNIEEINVLRLAKPLQSRCGPYWIRTSDFYPVKVTL